MSTTFDSLDIDSRVLDGIQDMGFTEMTPIQEQAIPIALAGDDLIGAAQTGTGKTAAFLIPMLNRLVQLGGGATRAIVLTPTRELALQIEEQMVGLAYHAGVTCACIVGGQSFGYQERVIREKAEVLIVTPGRMIDHMRYDHVDFNTIEFVVLDEADRMLDMGFLPAVQKILGAVPEKRQTMLFSATMSPEVKKIAAQFMKNPKEIQIGRLIPVAAIQQRFLGIAPHSKEELLVHLLQSEGMNSVLVFARTKREVQSLDKKLRRAGIPCDALHGDRLQEERVEALDRFRRGEVSVLVATDIASRGLDINDVTHVINFDIPTDPDDYIHRVGRTARAKKQGDAITFVTKEDKVAFQKIEKAIQKTIKIERAVLPRRSTSPQRSRRR